jgi:hypothetical protein
MRSLRVGKFTIAVVTAVVCVLGASRGYATTVTYTSAASFDAATTGQNTINFNAALTCSAPCFVPEGASFAQGGITFTTTAPALNLNSANLDPPTIFPSDFLSNSFPPGGLTDTLTITLGSAVTAFALDFTTPDGSNASFGLSNGFTTSVPTSAFGPSQFEGFVSDSPFNAITLSVPSPDGYFVFDVTTATAAVPEPSTWAMMIIGFLGLGLLAHRRGKNDATSFA